MPIELNLTELNQQIRDASAWTSLLQREIGRVVVGQKYLVDRLIVGLLANGHVLLEGVPGLAKTLTVRTLARAIDAKFSRIQFTPDLLPADIVGTLIYNPRDGQFTTKRGPIFANLVLADEINRAPAKVQSALLEGMQEHQVTIGDTTYALPEPFLVLATENPVEQEGTYPLPEAQVDRFMLKLKIGYPTRAEERKILDAMAVTSPDLGVNPVVQLSQILEARKLVSTIYVDDKVKDYIVDMVFATREPEAAKLKDLKPLIQYGASPRATIALTLAARAWAFLQGRAYVTPQDIKTIGPDVLRHRIIVTYEAEAENITSEDIIKRVFDTIPVP
ncbi:MAG: MoxR family ATPase [Verrucomicrobiota bacterium]|nr:MoxR family ATPase [Verrucomicrobiota bacterium]